MTGQRHAQREGAAAGGCGTPRHPLGSLEKAFSPREASPPQKPGLFPPPAGPPARPSRRGQGPVRQTRCRRQPTWADRSPGRGGGAGALCCLKAPPPPHPPHRGLASRAGPWRRRQRQPRAPAGKRECAPGKPPRPAPARPRAPTPARGADGAGRATPGRRGTPPPPPAGGGRGAPPSTWPTRPPHTRTAFPRGVGAAKTGGGYSPGAGNDTTGSASGTWRDVLERSRSTNGGARQGAERGGRTAPPRHGEGRTRDTGARAQSGAGPLRQETSAPPAPRGGWRGSRGRAGFRTPPLPTRRLPAGGRGEGPAGQSEKSGPIRQECPSLVWRGLGPARESVTSPHRSGHRERPPGRRRDEDGDRRSLAPALAAPAFLGGKRGRRAPREGNACHARQAGPGHRDHDPRSACAAGEGTGDARGAARRDTRPSSPLASLPPLTAPAATLGCCRPEGSAAVPRGAWVAREPARGTAPRKPEGGKGRASGGGQAPTKGPRTHALRKPGPLPEPPPEDSLPTPLWWHKMSTSGADNFRVPRRGRYPRASAASAEVASATGPRSAPHRGYREERLGPLVDPRNPGGGGVGRGADVEEREAAARAHHRSPLAGKRPAPARSTAPPSWDLGRGRVERPAEAAKDGRAGLPCPTPNSRRGPSRGAGQRGKENSRQAPGGPRACPREPAGPSPPRRPARSSPARPGPDQPGPHPRNGETGKNLGHKVASGDPCPTPTPPREHARGPGTPSPADARGRRPVTSPDRDLAKHVAQHRRAQRPGPRWVPRPAPRRPGSVGNAGAGRGKIRKRGPTQKGRRRAGPAGAERPSPSSSSDGVPVRPTRSGQPRTWAPVTPSETCTSNLRRSGEAPTPRHHRDVSAGEAARPRRLPAHSGQIPPLVSRPPELRRDATI